MLGALIADSSCIFASKTEIGSYARELCTEFQENIFAILIP